MANLNDDVTVMTVMAQLLAATPSSVFASVGGKTYIEDEFDLVQSSFPALHFMAGPQAHARTSLSTWEGSLTVVVKYYQRFDVGKLTIDAVRRQINTDLNLMKDYLAGNDSLTSGNAEHARSISQIHLSSYAGEIEERQGAKLVSRTLMAVVNLLEYDVP